MSAFQSQEKRHFLLSFFHPNQHFCINFSFSCFTAVLPGAAKAHGSTKSCYLQIESYMEEGGGGRIPESPPERRRHARSDLSRNSSGARWQRGPSQANNLITGTSVTSMMSDEIVLRDQKHNKGLSWGLNTGRSRAQERRMKRIDGPKGHLCGRARSHAPEARVSVLSRGNTARHIRSWNQ